jgi:hypothetical protein
MAAGVVLTNSLCLHGSILAPLHSWPSILPLDEALPLQACGGRAL